VKQRAKFLNTIKEKLLQRKDEMTQMLSKSTHEKVSDGQVQDTADEALSITMEALQNSLQQSEIDELRMIDDAIARIDKGEFGFCIDCEEHISEKRLEHYPYAARCVVCQESFEG